MFTRSSLFLIGIVLVLCLTESAKAFVTSRQKRTSWTHTYSYMSSDGSVGDFTDGEKRRRAEEFLNLEPLKDSDARRQRKDKDVRNSVQFAKYGNDLWTLRSSMVTLSSELIAAITSGKRDIANAIRTTLRKIERRDAELVYQLELEAMEQAKVKGDINAAEQHKATALNARACLPQFNLEGLWVGKYGNHGYELINVTYAGDTLIAYKVTGDNNVPRGEITFQADLSPLNPKRIGEEGQQKQPLQPIILTDKASQKWGTRELPRYSGLGQVAEEGFTQNRWMEGQLIIIGQEYFSFAWVPIEQQIFFGRPSAEMALKMLRLGGAASLQGKTWEEPPSVEDDVSVLQDFAARCFELTTEAIDEELSGDEFGCIWHGHDTEECYFE